MKNEDEPKNQSTILPYRVRISGSTVAAFDNYEEAASHAKRVLEAMMISKEVCEVSIQFSMEAI